MHFLQKMWYLHILQRNLEFRVHLFQMSSIFKEMMGKSSKILFSKWGLDNIGVYQSGNSKSGFIDGIWSAAGLIPKSSFWRENVSASAVTKITGRPPWLHILTLFSFHWIDCLSLPFDVHCFSHCGVSVAPLLFMYGTSFSTLSFCLW